MRHASLLRSLFVTAALSAALVLVAPTDIRAQRVGGAVGIGAQGGAPTGVTLKVHNDAGASYDFLAAWDGAQDSFFLFNAHAQFNQNLNTSNIDEGQLEWFIGPGAFVGFFGDAPGDDDFDEGDAVIGASGRIGLNFAFADNFELYGQFTPRIALVPGTDLYPGGGIGLRFYP